MFGYVQNELEPNQLIHFELTKSGQKMTYAQVIHSWEADEAFCLFFSRLLQSVEFEGFRWETPRVTSDTLEQLFQCVIWNSPSFAERRTNSSPFHSKFESDNDRDGIVVFENLGANATLVVPSPLTDDDAYGHLTAFLRKAPERQIVSLWRVIAETMKSKIGTEPKWLSTAGGGVAWLHVRIDDRPKYYGYSEYRNGM